MNFPRAVTVILLVFAVLAGCGTKAEIPEAEPSPREIPAEPPAERRPEAEDEDEPEIDGITAAAPEADSREVPPTAEPVPFALSGLGTSFVFAVPSPILWWDEQPAGTKIRIQVSSDRTFREGSLVLDAVSVSSFQALDFGLEGETVYYLRGRRIPAGGEDEPWVPAVLITYRPLALAMRTVLEPGAVASFRMGNDRGMPRERPSRTVNLTRPYEMAVHEMTNGLLAEIMNRMLPGGEARILEGNVAARDGTPYLGLRSMNYGFQFGLEMSGSLVRARRGREDHPAVGISWYGAVFICDSLSRMFGLRPAYGDGGLSATRADRTADGYRLPSEAEWEYAARGPRSFLFPGGAAAPDPRSANFHRSGDPFETMLSNPTLRGGPTTPVGFYSGGMRGQYRTVNGASPAGLHDMLGNVWEWCDDFFDPGYYSRSPDRDPPGPDDGVYRAVRGAAWNTPRADVSLATRGWYRPDGLSYSLGFRPARTSSDASR